MIDTRIVRNLKAIESVAVIPRVASTNLIARRIVTECIENELSLPQAIIIAGEQFAGRGRNDRRWSSPPGKGIYATTLVTRPARELPLVPLAMASFIAIFLRAEYGIDARIKWPNDILVDRRKIAGILMEARIQEDRVFLLIGTGIAHAVLITGTGAAAHWSLGNVDTALVGQLLIGSVPGVLAGGWLARHSKPSAVRWGATTLVLLSGLTLLSRA